MSAVPYRSTCQGPGTRFGFSRRASGFATVAVVAILVTACAGKGGVATPRPFPGASVPRTGQPTDAATATASIHPEVVALALSLRGTAYRNGGSDPSGFDCSGFVQWVFAQHGMALPREVRQQYGIGREVESDEVRPGDLVFFETVAKGASHVGIALGGGEFVHAPSSRGVVRIERYTNGYWAERWVGARRIHSLGQPAS